jgi:hypothetical protein
MDLQIGGASRFRVDKAGNIGSANTTLLINNSGYGFGFRFDGSQVWGNSGAQTIVAANSYSQGWADVLLARDAANTLALRNGTNANTLRCYGTYTDASNGRRLDITSTTAGIFTLTATGNGTGATGNLLKLTQPILLPATSVSLATNGDLAFEATSNTTLTIRYRGSDGTTRSATIALI